MMNTRTLNKVEAFIEGVKSGRIPDPKICGLCDLYDNLEAHDCIICCHPPIEDVYSRPNWCPLKEEEKDE